MASILKVNEIQHTGGTSALTVDSSGNVDIPSGYFTVQNSIVWEVTKSTSVTSGVWIYDRVLVDSASAMNSSNGRFIAPVAGYYYTQFTWLSDSATQETNVSIRKNGDSSNEWKRIRQQGHANHISMSGHRIAYLNANDYFEINVDAGHVYGDANTWTTWSGFLVG